MRRCAALGWRWRQPKAWGFQITRRALSASSLGRWGPRRKVRPQSGATLQTTFAIAGRSSLRQLAGLVVALHRLDAGVHRALRRYVAGGDGILRELGITVGRHAETRRRKQIVVDQNRPGTSGPSAPKQPWPRSPQTYHDRASWATRPSVKWSRGRFGATRSHRTTPPRSPIRPRAKALAEPT